MFSTRKVFLPWSDCVLVEMTSRYAKLEKSYDQTFER